jgi:hypothetical protein
MHVEGDDEGGIQEVTLNHSDWTKSNLPLSLLPDQVTANMGKKEYDAWLDKTPRIKKYYNHTRAMIQEGRLRRARTWQRLWPALLGGEPPENQTPSEQAILAELQQSDHLVLRYLATKLNPTQHKVQEEMAQDLQEASYFLEFCRRCHQEKDCPLQCQAPERGEEETAGRTTRSTLQQWARINDLSAEVVTVQTPHGQSYHDLVVAENLQRSEVVHQKERNVENRQVDAKKKVLATSSFQAKGGDRDLDEERFDKLNLTALFGEERTFTAYDCSIPSRMRVIRARTQEDCSRRTPVLRTKKDIRYHLLQEVPFFRVPARKCAMTRSKIPLYCGHYDHQTLATPDI